MITIIDSFDRLASFLSNSKLKCRRTIIMIDKINDYLSFYQNDIAQKYYYDHIASFCRMNGIRSVDKLYHFDQSESSEDLKQLISKNSRKNKGKIHYSEKSIPISPTPNSLVSETPRGKKCTAEEESNQ